MLAKTELRQIHKSLKGLVCASIVFGVVMVLGLWLVVNLYFVAGSTILFLAVATKIPLFIYYNRIVHIIKEDIQKEINKLPIKTQKEK